MSENYYVLKGQQSSWLKNNKKAEYTHSYPGTKPSNSNGGSLPYKAIIWS